MQPLTIRYGNTTETLNNISRGELVRVIEPMTSSVTASNQEILQACLANPIQSPRLRDLAKGKNSAAIMIPGKTRIAATSDYVPALVDELIAGGIPLANIEVYLATGTHEQHLECDFVGLLGEETANKIKCIAHDCKNRDELVQLGETSYGTPVFFNKRVLAADLKILTGRIVPHYFAGFSGGRKALLPGVAGMKTIVANHGLTIDPVKGLHPKAKACQLEGNPIHLDMIEAVSMAKPDFCLNTILDQNHRLIAAYAGDWQAAHLAGCQEVGNRFQIKLESPVDAVISSAGGNPYDCNFMQSLKAAFNIADIIKPGGSLLWISECPAGIQEGFDRWAAFGSDEEMEAAIREKYDLKGHNSLMLRMLTRKAKVALWSKLPADVVRQLGLHPVSSLSEGIDWLTANFADNFSYAYVPFANVTHATLNQ